MQIGRLIAIMGVEQGIKVNRSCLLLKLFGDVLFNNGRGPPDRLQPGMRRQHLGGTGDDPKGRKKFRFHPVPSGQPSPGWLGDR